MRLDKALQRLENNDDTLTSLDLRGSNLGAAGVASIAEALKTNKTLTSLGLGFNGIGDAGAASIAEALKTNKTLTSLELRGNDLGAAGVASIAEALKTNNTLTSLNIDLIGDDFGDADAASVASLAEALKTNKTLTSLDIGPYFLSGADVRSLTRALKTNSTLTSLDFSCKGPDTSDLDNRLERNKKIQKVTEEALQEMNDFMTLLTRDEFIAQETITEGATRIAAVIENSEKEIKKLYQKASQLDLIQARYQEVIIQLSIKQPNLFDSHAATEIYCLLADTQKESPHLQDMGQQLMITLSRQYTNYKDPGALVDIINLRLLMEKPEANVQTVFVRALGAYFNLPDYNLQTDKVFAALSQINSDQLTKEQQNILKQINFHFAPKEEKLRQLQDSVSRVTKNYCDYSKSIWFSFFHRHGETGRKRAQDFKQRFSQMNDYDEARKVLVDFLSNPKNGNTHPHSFRTMLLHELPHPERHQSYEDTLTHFSTQLAKFTSEHCDINEAVAAALDSSDAPQL